MDVKRGDRVRLLFSADEFTRLRPGEEGEVVFVDSLGTVHVKWDSGPSLGLIPGVDRFQVIEATP